MPFLFALFGAAVLTPLAGALGRSAGLVDRPDEEGLKIHRREVPLTGGAAVLAAAAGAAWLSGSRPLAGLWAAAAVAFVVGTADDRRALPPVARVGGLTIAAVVFVLMTPAAREAGFVWWLAAALLVLVGANALNIVDGQDALAGGLAAVSTLSLSLLTALSDLGGVTSTGLALGGAALGFLVWNRPPARVFLGNGGAYGVGLLLGAQAWFLTAIGGVRGLLAAGACLGPLVFEVVFTVLRRLGARDRLARGDRLHSYDLVARTAGRTASTVVFIVLGVLSAGLGVLIWLVPTIGIPLAAVAAALATLWGLLLWTRRPAPT